MHLDILGYTYYGGSVTAVLFRFNQPTETLSDVNFQDPPLPSPPRVMALNLLPKKMYPLIQVYLSISHWLNLKYCIFYDFLRKVVFY